MSTLTKRKVVSRVWQDLNTTKTCTHAEGPRSAFQKCGAPAAIERAVTVRYVDGREDTIRSYFCRPHGEDRKTHQHEMPARITVTSNALVQNAEGYVQVIGHALCMVRVDVPANTLVACHVFDITLVVGDRVRVAKTLDGRQKAIKI